MRWPRRCSTSGSGSTCRSRAARWRRSDIARSLDFDPQPTNSPCRVEARVAPCALRRGRLEVERLAHARRHALLPQRLLVFLAQKGILQPIWNGGTAVGHVDGALVGVFFARYPRLVLAMVVGTVPAD